MTYLRAGDLEGLWPGEMKGVLVGALKVLLVNLDGQVLAYEDRCAHKGVELSKGRLAADGTLTCWAHAWQYDLRTGGGANPRGVSLRRLPVRIDGDQIWVDVGGPG